MSPAMLRLALINPNTDDATTRAMLAIARRTQPDVTIDGFTAAFGAPLITDDAALATATLAVESRAPDLRGYDGVVVAAFGDPGAEALRRLLVVPVIGIAEAGMAEAAKGNRRFAVATTTPALSASIARTADFYGHGSLFVGTFLTPGVPEETMADPCRLVAALGLACAEAIEAGAEAVVIGGGPLAQAAQALRGTLSADLIEPVPAAIRLARVRSQTAG